MKKIGSVFKQTSENMIKDNLKKNHSVFIIKYSGLSSPDLSSLRLSLKGARANIFMVKNSVARRALKASGLDSLNGLVEGPCGFVFSREEPVDVSRILYDFSREHEKLKLEGGYMQDKLLSQADIHVLAKLPSKHLLRTMLVIALNSPVSGLVCTLNQVLRKFVYCLGQVRDKKRGGENG